jgi:hypothetical protein
VQVAGPKVWPGRTFSKSIRGSAIFRRAVWKSVQARSNPPSAWVCLNRRGWACAECGMESPSGSFVYLQAGEPRCLACTGIDRLEFLLAAMRPSRHAQPRTATHVLWWSSSAVRATLRTAGQAGDQGSAEIGGRRVHRRRSATRCPKSAGGRSPQRGGYRRSRAHGHQDSSAVPPMPEVGSAESRCPRLAEAGAWGGVPAAASWTATRSRSQYRLPFAIAIESTALC